jgi:hypothetical protein
MSSTESKLADQLKPQAMTMRLIVGALALGVLSTVVVSVLLRADRGLAEGPLQFELITWFGIIAAPVAVVASRIVPILIVRTARKRMVAGDYRLTYAGADKAYAINESDALAGLYQTTTIVAAALLEGAAFLNVIAFLLEGNPISLGLAIGLAMGILAMYPSGQRIAIWIELQLRLIEEHRQVGK